MKMIIDKWKHTSDSTDGIYWQTYTKGFSINNIYYEIEVYKEFENDWQMIFWFKEDQEMQKIYQNMFGDCAQYRFLSIEEAKDMVEFFLEKLSRLAAFI